MHGPLPTAQTEQTSGVVVTVVVPEVVCVVEGVGVVVPEVVCDVVRDDVAEVVGVVESHRVNPDGHVSVPTSKGRHCPLAS